MNRRKLFWLLAAAFGVLAGAFLSLVWSVAALAPILVLSWWIVYRSEWF